MEIKGNIKELRVKDGGYDFYLCCWTTNGFIIITDQTVYCFKEDPQYEATENGEENCCRWMITETASYDPQEYKYKLRMFNENSLTFDSYSGPEDETLVLQYEDVFLNIFAEEDGGSLLTLDETNMMSGRQIVDEDDIHSKYITWDEYEESYKIEFVDENGNIVDGKK